MVVLERVAPRTANVFSRLANVLPEGIITIDQPVVGSSSILLPAVVSTFMLPATPPGLVIVTVPPVDVRVRSAHVSAAIRQAKPVVESAANAARSPSYACTSTPGVSARTVRACACVNQAGSPAETPNRLPAEPIESAASVVVLLA